MSVFLPKFVRKILTKLLCKKNPYLEEIGVTNYSCNHCGGISSLGDIRSHLRNERIRRKTGIDPRDCWDLDTTFFQWLYCNCKQLLKDTNADLTWRTYEHNGKTYTEGEYIEYLIDLCKQVMLFDEFKDCPEIEWETEKVKDPDTGCVTIKYKNTEEELKRFREQTKLNGLILQKLERETFDVFYDLLHALWW